MIKHTEYEDVSKRKCVAMQLKFVSKSFQESRSQKKPRASRITPNDFVKWVGSNYDVQPRFHKALQHLRDRDNILHPSAQQMHDELDKDLLKERKEEIESYLWAHFVRYVKQISEFGIIKKPTEVHDKDPAIARLKTKVPVSAETTLSKDELRSAFFAIVYDEFVADVCASARASYVHV